MKTSEEITRISIAYIKAWAETSNMRKTGNVPGKFDFMELKEIMKQLKAILPRYGLAVLQMPAETKGEFVALVTRIIHESGEWMEETATFPMMGIITTRDGRPVISSAQAAGGGLTFIRRQALCALFGIVGDADADANVDWEKIKDETVLSDGETRVLMEWQEVFSACGEMDELKSAYIKAHKRGNIEGYSPNLKKLILQSKDIRKELIESGDQIMDEVA